MTGRDSDATAGAKNQGVGKSSQDSRDFDCRRLWQLLAQRAGKPGMSEQYLVIPLFWLFLLYETVIKQLFNSNNA
jgi:hypothetical protein